MKFLSNSSPINFEEIFIRLCVIQKISSIFAKTKIQSAIIGFEMTTEEKIGYWTKISDEDLKVAQTMLENHYHLYTGFMCHQAIEKIIKAGYVKIENATPPYSHDLPRLATLAGFYDLFSEKQKLFLNTLNPLNIEARYPDYKDQIAKMLTNERCTHIFGQTKQLQQWIKDMIL